MSVLNLDIMKYADLGPTPPVMHNNATPLLRMLMTNRRTTVARTACFNLISSLRDGAMATMTGSPR